MSKIPPYPCDICSRKDKCPVSNDCGKWENWFRAYWNGLREMFRTEIIKKRRTFK